MMIAMDVAALMSFLAEHFPVALEFGFTVDAVDASGVTIRLQTEPRHLRPGGTVSGPTLMTLADTGAYLAILSRVGPKAGAVTTHLEMHFLRKPRPGTLVTHARIIKLGRRLAVVVAEFRLDGDDELVAMATVTYALPT